MTRGTEVVRVSLRSDNDGRIGDQGTVERIHRDGNGQVYALTVEWRNTEAHPFVLAHRVVTAEDWARDQARKGAAA